MVEENNHYEQKRLTLSNTNTCRDWLSVLLIAFYTISITIVTFHGEITKGKEEEFTKNVFWVITVISWFCLTCMISNIRRNRLHQEKLSSLVKIGVLNDTFSVGYLQRETYNVEFWNLRNANDKNHNPPLKHDVNLYSMSYDDIQHIDNDVSAKPSIEELLKSDDYFLIIACVLKKEITLENQIPISFVGSTETRISFILKNQDQNEYFDSIISDGSEEYEVYFTNRLNTT